MERVTLGSRVPFSFVLRSSFHMRGRVPLGVGFLYLQGKETLHG